MKVVVVGVVMMLGLVVGGFAQNTDIVRVAPADAAKLKTAYEAMKKAEETFKTLKKEIETKHSTKSVVTGEVEWPSCLEFNKDFDLAIKSHCQLGKDINIDDLVKQLEDSLPTENKPRLLL